MQAEIARLMDEVQDLKGSFGERSALADQLSSTKAALEEARGKLEGLEGTAEEAAHLLEQNELLKERLDKTEGQVRLGGGLEEGGGGVNLRWDKVVGGVFWG